MTARGHSVIVADDHKIVLASIEALLATTADFQVVGRASDGEMALEMIRSLKPDVAVLDVSMPKLTGVDVIRILGDSAGPKVLLLTASLSETLLEDASTHGAWGLLTKDRASQDLLPVLRTIAAGKRCFPQAPPLHEPRGRWAARHGAAIAGLTELEKRVGALLGQGLRNAEICAALDLSQRDLKLQLHSLCEKLEMPDRETLAALMASQPPSA